MWETTTKKTHTHTSHKSERKGLNFTLLPRWLNCINHMVEKHKNHFHYRRNIRLNPRFLLSIRGLWLLCLHMVIIYVYIHIYTAQSAATGHTDSALTILYLWFGRTEFTNEETIRTPIYVIRVIVRLLYFITNGKVRNQKGFHESQVGYVLTFRWFRDANVVCVWWRRRLSQASLSIPFATRDSIAGESYSSSSMTYVYVMFACMMLLKRRGRIS